MKLMIIIISICFLAPSVLYASAVWTEYSYRINGSFCFIYSRYIHYDSATCELETYPEALIKAKNIEHYNCLISDWQNYDGRAEYPEGESVGGCDGSMRYYDCSSLYESANNFAGEFSDAEEWWYYSSTGSNNNKYRCMSLYKNSSGDVIDHRSSDYHSVDPSVSSDCVSDKTFAAMNSNSDSCDQPSNAFDTGIYTEFEDPASTYACIDTNGDGADDNSGAGCVMVATPRADDNTGDPGNKAAIVDSRGCPEGSPIWKINMVNMNFYITDIPIWYNSPIGPPVRVQLSYNSEPTLLQRGPFGRKWTFNYRSFLDIDHDGNVTVIMPDGRKDLYGDSGADGYENPPGVKNRLERISDYHYRLNFIDGSKYIYRIPEGSGLSTPVLVQIADAYGQRLVLGYDSNDRLVTITDALGRVTAIVDDNNDGLIDRINDPFGRSAHFTYNMNGDLVMITDMGGYTSAFTYDDELYVASISNERGTWGIEIEPSDGMVDPLISYPEPGGSMGENYRITVSDPLGNKEEYYYNGAYSWYISSNDYASYESNETNNYRTSPKTIYVLTGNRKTRNIGKIQHPEGGYLEYEYDPLTNELLYITDNHGEGIGHTTEFSYNEHGLVTSVKDNRSYMTYAYYPNGIDVRMMENALGTITYTYNSAHDITSITDRQNNVTSLTYNSFGQLVEMVEAQGTSLQSVMTFIYDQESHGLLEMQKNGNTVTFNTYDDIGRIVTSIDESGLSLGYEYNDLDQVTKIKYPDGRNEQFNYSTCCPRLIDSKTARSGLTTSYEYDALKRLLSVQHAENVIGYEYDANGNMIKLTDENGNVTSFEYDLDNRLTTKIFADGASLTYVYDLAGLLEKVVNSREIEKVFSYDSNHNVTGVTYSDTTPAILMNYDDHNRLIERSDGVGSYSYSYDVNNRLVAVNGPLDDDTINFGYDELGRLQTMITQKGSEVSYSYDGLGRLKSIHSGLDLYSYEYQGYGPFVKSLTRPNGSITEYYYDDALKRLTSIIDKWSTGEVISEKSFLYNELDLINKERVTGLESVISFQKGAISYNYNNTNQLVSTVSPDLVNEYDIDGNMVAVYSPDSLLMDMIYDAENRLKSLEYVDENDIVHKIEYLYNGDSLLAETRRYEEGALIDSIRLVRNGFSVLQERDAQNNVTNEYTWGPGMGGGIGGLLNLNRDGFDYSYLYDGRGNVSAILDGSQKVVASYGYNVFGKRISKNGDFEQPYQFSTKRYDEVSGLSYYGYRFYNPAIGRWMTRDPLGEAGGINLYGFVGNNPVNRVDPFGLDETSWFGYGRNPFKEGPRNGNWGGGNYSGGQNPLVHDGRSGTAGPVDSGDYCYYLHDRCYEMGKESVGQCDTELVENLNKLDENPKRWPVPPRRGTGKQSEIYRKWAIWWFTR